MSTRGRSIAADTQALTDAPLVRLWRVAAAIASLVLVNLVAIAAFLAASPRAHAEAPAPRNVPVLVTQADMRTGALLLKASTGPLVEATALGTDIDIDVTGQIRACRVTQLFHNPADGWVEGVYVFPLPEDGGRRHAEHGDRRARHHRRHQGARGGRQIYEEAKAKGQKAASSSRSGPTSSPTRSPISARMRPWSCRSNIRSRCASPAGCSRCACRWWWGRATSRNRRADGRVLRRRARVGTFRRPGARSRRPPPVLDPRNHLPVNPVSIAVHLHAGFRWARSRAPIMTSSRDDEASGRRSRSPTAWSPPTATSS